MHPLVRWQFRGGIAEKDRKAFLFTNVIDSKGRKYDIPVLVGGLAVQPRNLSHRARLRVRGDGRALGARDPKPDPAAHRRGRALP